MCSEPGFINVLDPIGRPASDRAELKAAPRLPSDLRGTRVAIIDNRINGMSVLAERLAGILGAAGAEVVHAPIPQFPPIESFTPKVLDSLLGPVDLVIIGLGNCGSCTTWDARFGGVVMARCPAVQVVTKPFVPLAEAAARNAGYRDVPTAVLPGPDVSDWGDAGVADAMARLVVDAIARPSASC